MKNRSNLLDLIALIFVFAVASTSSGSDSDPDSDGIVMEIDNCLNHANGFNDPKNHQLDSDHDGYGNACDADYDNDGDVDFDDQDVFLNNFQNPNPGITDHDGDGEAGDLDDWNRFLELFGGSPGPSGLHCEGSVVCFDASVQNPAGIGPFATHSLYYNIPDAAGGPNAADLGFTASEWIAGSRPEFKTELRGIVTYPSSPESPFGPIAGNFPLVLIMHGREPVCTTFTSFPINGVTLPGFGFASPNSWPCPPGEFGAPLFAGYQEFAHRLASHGFVVVSIGALGIKVYERNATEINPDPDPARGDLIDRHLCLWKNWATSNGPEPFLDLFAGAADLSKVGLIGHSRGGEGIADHYIRYGNVNDCGSGGGSGSAYQVEALLFLAATDGFRPILTDVDIGVVQAANDAIVSGVHYYDDSRYASAADSGAKHVFFAPDGVHRDWNYMLSPSNLDGTGGALPCGSDAMFAVENGELPPESGCYSEQVAMSPYEHQSTFAGYASTFFRAYLAEETQTIDQLIGEDVPVAASPDMRVSYHAPADLRLDVNRFETDGNEMENDLIDGGGVGGDVTVVDLDLFDVCGGEIPYPECFGENVDLSLAAPVGAQVPQVLNVLGVSVPGFYQVSIGWDLGSSGQVGNEIPGDFKNVAGYQFLQFRSALNYDESPAGVNPDFAVQLVDGQQNVGSVSVASYSNALSQATNNTGANLIFLSTVNIPLSSIVGVDLHDIVEIRFDFSGQPTAGVVHLADLAFSDIHDLRDGPGVVRAGASGRLDWSLDLDGDGDEDESFCFGNEDDLPVVGDWNANGVSGVGAVRPDTSGNLTWRLSHDRKAECDQPDAQIVFGSAGDVPLAADVNGDGVHDLVAYRIVEGVPTFSIKYDLGNPSEIPLTVSIASGIVEDPSAGTPLVGDWNGDGAAELAVVTSVIESGVSKFKWNIDQDLDGVAELSVLMNGAPPEVPCSSDFNGDKRDDLGSCVPASAGQSNAWYSDTDHDGAIETTIQFSGAPTLYSIVGDWKEGGRIAP